jgi:hypothetical protein
MFLSIVTRTYFRERLLSLNKASLQIQTCRDFEHVIIRDRVGLGAAKANLLYHTAEVKGDYVLPLDDDDILTDQFVVEKLKKLITPTKPPFVIVKAKHPWGVIPEPIHWGRGLPPYGSIGNSSVVVRKDVWDSHKKNYTPYNQGDWKFAQSLFDDYTPLWLDLVVVTVPAVNHGKAEMYETFGSRATA